MTDDLPTHRPKEIAPEPKRLEPSGDPLDFIKEEHIHMRAMCEDIDRIAEAPSPDGARVSKVIAFLSGEVALLFADEDNDLRDVLLMRCSPDDDIVPTLDRLRAEHDDLAAMMPKLIADLSDIREQDRPAWPHEAASLRDFSDRLSRHLVTENAIVLPFARARLSADDLDRLRAEMIHRRHTKTRG